MVFIESRAFVTTSAIVVPACIFLAFFGLDALLTRGHITFTQADSLRSLLFFPIALFLLPIVVSSVIHMFRYRRIGWLLSLLVFSVFAMYAYGFWLTGGSGEKEAVAGSFEGPERAVR